VKGQTYKRCKCPPELLVDADGRRINCTRKHGTWYYRHDLPPAADGRRRQVKQGGFATEREARKALTDALARLDRGVYVDRSKLAVGTYLDEWLAGRVNLRPASVVFYRVAVDRYLKPELGHLRLSDLRADDIERAFGRIRRGVDGRGNPVSPALIARLKTTLRAALNVAVKRGLLHANPVLHVEIVAHSRPAVHVWDAATTGRFLDATSETQHGAMWHLIASFGLRRGEAAGLRWSDVDLELGVALIAVQRTQIGRQVLEAAPKTKAGARALSLDAGTVEVLRSHRTRQAAARLAWGAAWVDSGLVFTHEDGRGLQPQYVTRLFSKACRDGGFPPIRLHDLRHTSASLGLAAGETLVEVSKRLGHSQLAITADTYTHVLPVVALASSEARAALIPRVVTPIRTAVDVPTPVPTEAVSDGDVPSSCPPRPVRRVNLSGGSHVSAGHRPAALLLPHLDLNQKPCD
jgi:integrase